MGSPGGFTLGGESGNVPGARDCCTLELSVFKFTGGRAGSLLSFLGGDDFASCAGDRAVASTNEAAHFADCIRLHIGKDVCEIGFLHFVKLAAGTSEHRGTFVIAYDFVRVSAVVAIRSEHIGTFRREINCVYFGFPIRLRQCTIHPTGLVTAGVSCGVLQLPILVRKTSTACADSGSVVAQAALGGWLAGNSETIWIGAGNISVGILRRQKPAVIVQRPRRPQKVLLHLLLDIFRLVTGHQVSHTDHPRLRRIPFMRLHVGFPGDHGLVKLNYLADVPLLRLLDF